MTNLSKRMRFSLFLTFFLLLTGFQSLFGQFYLDPPTDGEPIYVINGTWIVPDTQGIDRAPEFPAGELAMYQHLENNLSLTFAERDDVGRYGESLVVFQLDAAGRTSKVEVLRTTERMLDYKLVRAFQNMPDWRPAVINGVESAITVYIPLAYYTTSTQLRFDFNAPQVTIGKDKSNGIKWTKALLIAGSLGLLAGLVLRLN